MPFHIVRGTTHRSYAGSAFMGIRPDQQALNDEQSSSLFNRIPSLRDLQYVLFAYDSTSHLKRTSKYAGAELTTVRTDAEIAEPLLPWGVALRPTDNACPWAIQGLLTLLAAAPIPNRQDRGLLDGGCRHAARLARWIANSPTTRVRTPCDGASGR